MGFAYPELDEFWERLAKDPHREARNKLIWAFRQAGIDNSLSVDDAQRHISGIFRERGYFTTIKVLYHLAYHAPEGSDLKQWAVNEVVNKALGYADEDARAAMDELRKAACFTRDDAELDHAVVPVCMTLARRRFESLDPDHEHYARDLGLICADLRDAAYLARPRSFLEREACRLFESFMDELKAADSARYFQLFMDSLVYPHPDSVLEDTLAVMAQDGIRDIVAEDASLKQALGGTYALARQRKSILPKILDSISDVLGAGDPAPAGSAQIIPLRPRRG